MSRIEILALKACMLLMIVASITAVMTYREPDVDGLAKLMIQSNEQPFHRRFKTKGDEITAELYDVSDADLVTPVNLWRAK